MELRVEVPDRDRGKLAASARTGPCVGLEEISLRRVTVLARLVEALEDAVNGLQPVESHLHALGKRIVRGGGTCVLCIPEDAAIHLRYDRRTQRRDGMRIG